MRDAIAFAAGMALFWVTASAIQAIVLHENVVDCLTALTANHC